MTRTNLAAASDQGATSGPAGCGIAVMAKASQSGRAKTRLSPPLTPEQAATFNTAFLKDISANLLVASRHASIAGYMAYGPPGAEEFFRTNLPPEIGLFEMWRDGFGLCLHDTIAELLARGHGSAVVLNSDSPTLPTSILVATATLLAVPGDRVVLGPSVDGGYYLLGLKAAHRRIFADIDWSTEHVAAQTIERVREIGLELHMLPVWYDVDDAAGLHQLSEDLAGRVTDGSLAPFFPHHTAELMRDVAVRFDPAFEAGAPDTPRRTSSALRSEVA